MPTNSQVAAAFVAQKHTENRHGNMSVQTHGYHFPESPTEDFETLAFAYSYSTIIAALVRNLQTGKREVWITPEKYSHTTQGHKTKLLRALPVEEAIPVFTTHCVNLLAHSPVRSLNTQRNICTLDYDYACGYVHSVIRDVADKYTRQVTRQRRLWLALKVVTKTIILLSYQTRCVLVKECEHLLELQDLLRGMISVGEGGDRRKHTALLQGYLALEAATN